MIKVASPDMIILGLSRVNMERLMAGSPIRFDGKEVGVPDKTIAIIFGETELAIAEQLGLDVTNSDKPAN